MLSEHSGRIGFTVYAAVMALMLLPSAVLPAYSLRQPFPVETGLSGQMNAAPLSLLLIVPVSTYFGARAKRVGRVKG